MLKVGYYRTEIYIKVQVFRIDGLNYEHMNYTTKLHMPTNNYEFYCSPNISIKFIIVLMANVMNKKKTSMYIDAMNVQTKKLNNCTTT